MGEEEKLSQNMQILFKISAIKEKRDREILKEFQEL